MIRNATFLHFLIALTLLTGLFLSFPGLDLAVQAHFYRSDAGFFLRDHWYPQLVYHWTLNVVKVFVTGVLLIYLLNLIRKTNWLGLRHKAFIFLIGSLILGPGLIVHTGLKENWGRARPDAVEAFGGKRLFTPFYQPAGECKTNCSFVSGHAAAAFYTVAPALLIRSRGKRRIAISGAFMFGLLVSLGRVMQGKHFLSDVLFAGWITWAVIWIVYVYVMRERESAA